MSTCAPALYPDLVGAFGITIKRGEPTRSGGIVLGVLLKLEGDLVSWFGWSLLSVIVVDDRYGIFLATTVLYRAGVLALLDSVPCSRDAEVRRILCTSKLPAEAPGMRSKSIYGYSARTSHGVSQVFVCYRRRRPRLVVVVVVVCWPRGDDEAVTRPHTLNHTHTHAQESCQACAQSCADRHISSIDKSFTTPHIRIFFISPSHGRPFL